MPSKRYDAEATTSRRTSVRVADGELQGDAAAHAVADDVGVLDAEVSEQGGRVVGHLLVGDRAVDVGGVAVALQLDHDDLSGLGEPGQDRSQRVDRHVGAVQQEQRRARRRGPRSTSRDR